MTPNPFKVIVVGGGPIGITAALALTQANIDFVLLEKYGSVVTEVGSDVVISPIGTRILSQLGLFDEFLRVSAEMSIISRIDHQGNDIGSMHYSQFIKEDFGVGPRVLRRYDLTKILYSGLTESARQKLLTNKEVTSVETARKGTKVLCRDGTSYTGNVVIGADGAHSIVRSQMRKLAVESGSEQINDEYPFLTTFLCLWVRFPIGHLVPGTAAETHGYGAASQLFCDTKNAVSGVYIPLEEPTCQRLRFTEEDKEDLVAKWGALRLSNDGKITLASAWKSRIASGLVSLEEGVLRHWSWDGRLVLVGDAAHKFTPSTGAGCNNGIIDVVVLINKLRNMLHSPSTQQPNRKALDSMFQSYQELRAATVVSQCEDSGKATATATWRGSIVRFADLYVLPWQIVQKYFMDRLATKTSKTPAFDFLPADINVVGKVLWKTDTS